MMKVDNPCNWYEVSLPTRERKTRGHFSTPPQLVEDILDACRYTPERDLSQLRVLDPACGSGNFLTGATKRLMAFGEHAGHSEQVIATSIQRNIWGFDPDPIACFLAEMHLHATCTNNALASGREQVKGQVRGQAPYLLHIHQADALTLRWEENANVDLFLANPPYLAAKNNDLSGYHTMQHHGQIDSYLLFVQLALRVTRPHGWIGLVLPDPLLARINASQARECLLAQTTIHHLWHLAGVFTAGVGAAVIVAQKCTAKRLHTINWQREYWPTLLTRRVNQPSSIFDGHTGLPAGVSSGKFVSQSLLLSQPHAELRYLLAETRGTLLAHLHNQFQRQKETQRLRPLADFVTIKRGEEIGKDHPLLKSAEETGQARVGQPEGDGRSGSAQGKVPVSSTIPTWQSVAIVSQPADWYPVLRGGVDIKPYGSPTAQHWIPRTAIRKPLERYSTPKLLIIKSTGQLQATLDLQNHVVLQTLYLLHLRPQYLTQMRKEQVGQARAGQPEGDTRSGSAQGKVPVSGTIPTWQGIAIDELYFLLALLNSRLLQEYVYILHTAYKWVQPQIEQHVLAQLPIPTSVNTHEKARIIQRARLLMEACNKKNAVVEWKREYNELYEEQEQAICALYTVALTDTNSSIKKQVS